MIGRRRSYRWTSISIRALVPTATLWTGAVRKEMSGYSNTPRSLLHSWLQCTAGGRSGMRGCCPVFALRVSATRVRVPDLCLISRDAPKERVLTHSPLVVIEVLDEEDRLCAMMEKLADFERFGVQRIWVIEPERRVAYRYENGGMRLVVGDELIVPGTPMRLVLSEVFAELDRG